jgi:hypothetical protein
MQYLKLHNNTDRLGFILKGCAIYCVNQKPFEIQGGSNMTGTDLSVNKPQCAAAVRP